MGTANEFPLWVVERFLESLSGGNSKAVPIFQILLGLGYYCFHLRRDLALVVGNRGLDRVFG
jgi:hypothetical protein